MYVNNTSGAVWLIGVRQSFGWVHNSNSYQVFNVIDTNYHSQEVDISDLTGPYHISVQVLATSINDSGFAANSDAMVLIGKTYSYDNPS